MNRDTARQVVNVVAYIAVVVVNILANALPLNGQTTGEIASRFPVFFVPAGFTFAIWGLIYLLLAGFVIYQALPSQRENLSLRRIGYLFVLTAVANIAWLFLWHYNLFAFSLLAMFALLGSLIAIYLRLGIGQTPVSRREAWLIHVPFSVYLGWITVATIANVTIVLFLSGWDRFGLSPQVWAGALLGVGALITVAVIVTRTDVAFTLVILWAYAGIAIKQMAEPLVFAAAVGAMFAIAAALVLAVLQERGAL